MDQKQFFFNLLKNFVFNFLLNLFYNKNVYYLLCSCANPIFGKSLVLEIWAKMFSANQIAGFFNQLYLQNKSMKYLIFCMLLQIHIKVDPKNFEWACSEMAVSQE